MAVEIFRGVEGIVRFADVKRENRGVKLGFVQRPSFMASVSFWLYTPIAQEAGRLIRFWTCVLVQGAFVAAGQSVKRERPYLSSRMKWLRRSAGFVASASRGLLRVARGRNDCFRGTRAGRRAPY